MQRSKFCLSWLVCAGLLLAPACGSKDETTGETGETATGPTTDSETATPTTETPTTDDPSTETTTTTDGPTTTTDDPSTGPTTETTTTDDPFLVMPDTMVANQCDPTTQDCPDGEKCTAVSETEGEPWAINVCVTVTGSGQVGDPCDIEGGKYTGVDNCDLGFICLLSDEEGFGGTCTEFCDSNMGCPKSGNDCEVYNDGSLPICLGTCDPLVQDCPEGQGCYRGGSGDQFVCFKVTGESAHGEECGYINQCLAGYNCSGAGAVEGCPPEAAGCCSSFCDLSDPDPNEVCVGTEQCVQFLDPAPPQYMDVGVCVIP